MKRLNLDEDIQKQQVIFNEVKVLENLVHPNIIKYYETFQYEQKLCIVMEYAEGGDLKKRVTEKQHKKEFFDESQIWNMFSQICLAVKYLHDNKILHRDLKILNVFICNNGLIKLGDFGVSKQLENKDILTSTHVGTAYYLSPEQCNQHSYNHKVDIWMLGCLLYELCTLDKPFKSDNLLGLIKQITQNDPVPISDHYSSTMVQLVQVMMQKEPEMQIIWSKATFLLNNKYIKNNTGDQIQIKQFLFQKFKAKEQYPEVYKDYSFSNPKKYTGFLRIKQKPTLSFIPNDKKTLFVIGERLESGQSQPQSNEDELSNSIVSSDSSFQQQNLQQPNSASNTSPEKIQTKSQTQDSVQQVQKLNPVNNNSQVQKESQPIKKSSIDSQPERNKEQLRGGVEPQIYNQNQYNQPNGSMLNSMQYCQNQPDNNNFINQMQQNQKPFMTQEETFGMNKPIEDYVLQYPHHQQQQQQQQQTINNMQQSQYQMPYSNHHLNKNNIGNPMYRYIQQPLQQQQMTSFQFQQQHTPSYSTQNQYYDFFIGNAASNAQSENVSPINNNNNHPILSQQMSLQHNHLSQSQFGYQSGYIASGTNSNNSSVVMDLRSPNTQNSIPQQIMSEMSSPINMPFSPMNQYDPMPNHYQSPYPPYSQNNNQIQQFTPSNQQPLKKQPMKIPRYKPPIVIDTTIGGNFSQKKSTPNSDIQGRGSGLGSGRSGHSAQSSQKNSSLSSIMMMMMIDGENNNNNQGQSSSMYGSSYNNSGSSNTTSNQSSTKNNSTKNQHCQNVNQQQQYAHNLPTTKVKPKYFNFPQSPNRTILVSDYLKQKLGEEKFLKMKSILDSSSNPQEILENNPQVIAIIGEENIELAKVFRYLINSQRTPSGSNHLRHKSFQGFENPFPNSDQINKMQNISQSLLLSQNIQQQHQPQQTYNPSQNQNVAI